MHFYINNVTSSSNRSECKVNWKPKKKKKVGICFPTIKDKGLLTQGPFKSWNPCGRAFFSGTYLLILGTSKTFELSTTLSCLIKKLIVQVKKLPILFSQLIKTNIKTTFDCWRRLQSGSDFDATPLYLKQSPQDSTSSNWKCGSRILGCEEESGRSKCQWRFNCWYLY